MKKLLLLALTAVIMAGCDDVKEEYAGNGFSICTVDSCEYVVGVYKMSHKGNCRYCKQRRKQELKELVKQIEK